MPEDLPIQFRTVPLASLGGGPDPAPPARTAPPSFGTAPTGRRIDHLSGREKAAILVRLLLVQGEELNLSVLPEAMQADLTQQMARMRLVDRDTMLAVVAEFTETLEQVGLTFPEGLDGALQALTGKLSPGAAGRLRQLARATGFADPWDRIAQTETETLIELLAPESIEVAAVVISKLPVAKAAELLARMPGERSRRVALAVSQIEGIVPEAVARIGTALAGELDRRPPSAFTAPPAARVGAILNSSPSDLRDEVLASLDAEDADFANGVRKAIFTFGHIAARIKPTDVPKILREVDQTVLITALAAALPQTGTPIGDSAEYLLENMSQRMAAALRDEIEGRGKVRAKDADAAMSAVIAGIRNLVDLGDIALIEDDED